jgi:hypothetical protein
VSTVHSDIIWTRAAGCESSSCAQWNADAKTVRLRSSRNPDAVVEYTLDEFWQLIDAAVNGEIVMGDD